jgi:CDP-diacylglycerol pyrophosphatase
MKKAVILLVIAVTAFATSAIGLDQLALWQVVRACVADFKLMGAAIPCLEVDLSSGEDRGHAVLLSPRLNDLIVTPTRKIVGIEDPLLQSAEAPNYFNAAWRARSFLNGADGRAREHDEIALVANSAAVRTQDQLHMRAARNLLAETR